MSSGAGGTAIRSRSPDRIGADDRGALDQLISSACEKSAFGQRAHPVTRTSDALQSDRNGSRRSNLANKIYVADVDPELQGSRCYDDACFSRFQPLFSRKPDLPRQAAVMGGDCFSAESLFQPILKMMRHPLDQATRIDENQRGAMLENERGKSIVDVAPDGVRRDGTEFVPWDLNSKIHLSAVTDVDNCRT